MENILDFIIKDAMIMIPILWIVAEAIKRTEKIDSRWIPSALILFSLAFTPWLLGGYSAQTFAQAFLVAGGEMLLYQWTDKTFTGGKK